MVTDSRVSVIKLVTLNDSNPHDQEDYCNHTVGHDPLQPVGKAWQTALKLDPANVKAKAKLHELEK